MTKIILIFSLLHLSTVFPKLGGFRPLEEEFYRNKVAQVPEKFEGTPFEIFRNTAYVRLPDSLGGKYARGLCVLTIDIDKKGTIVHFYINKLTLKKNGKTLIEWYTGNSLTFNKYPSEIKRYYSFFRNYVAALKIRRNRYVVPEQINFEGFLVRFN